MLLILMIALLPLRGWASESMAVSMAAQQLLIADAQTARDAGMPADCPFVGKVSKISTTYIDSEIDSGTDSENISPLCKGCTTCQLCMALVTGYEPLLGIAAQLPHAKRLAISIGFSSAERMPGFKPPIS